MTHFTCACDKRLFFLVYHQKQKDKPRILMQYLLLSSPLPQWQLSNIWFAMCFVFVHSAHFTLKHTIKRRVIRHYTYSYTMCYTYVLTFYVKDCEKSISMKVDAGWWYLYFIVQYDNFKTVGLFMYQMLLYRGVVSIFM